MKIKFIQKKTALQYALDKLCIPHRCIYFSCCHLCLPPSSSLFVLYQMNHPMQVKPAISETKGEQSEERRLFVGMLSKTFTESDVRNMFAPFGAVEDVSILRDADSYSKGASFVRMGTRQQAQNAIRALHQSQTMPVSLQINYGIAVNMLFHTPCKMACAITLVHSQLVHLLVMQHDL